MAGRLLKVFQKKDNKIEIYLGVFHKTITFNKTNKYARDRRIKKKA